MFSSVSFLFASEVPAASSRRTAAGEAGVAGQAGEAEEPVPDEASLQGKTERVEEKYPIFEESWEPYHLRGFKN